MTELNSKSIEWLRSILVVMVLSVHVHPDHNPNWVAMDQLSGQPTGKFGDMVFNLGSPAGAALGYCTEILYIIAVGTAIYMLMIRFAPKLADIITGGRQSQKHIRI